MLLAMWEELRMLMSTALKYQVRTVDLDIFSVWDCLDGLLNRSMTLSFNETFVA